MTANLLRKAFWTRRTSRRKATPQERLAAALDLGTGGSTVNKAVGLHFTWFVHRGRVRA
jgi:hypothetical protein